MAKQKQAFYRHGRWLIFCTCGLALPAQDGVICPREYPQMLAKDLQRLPNGLFRPVPAIDLIDAERLRARENDEEYSPIYPPEIEEIERVLRLRTKYHQMNWEPNETLDDLLIQNLEHGDKVPHLQKIKSRLKTKDIDWSPSARLIDLLSRNPDKEEKNAVSN